jgi:hypothetical protein
LETHQGAPIAVTGMSFVRSAGTGLGSVVEDGCSNSHLSLRK